MLKNKNAILLLVMVIVCLLSGYAFATETTTEINAGKVFTKDDVDAVLKEDVSHTYSAVRVMDGGSLTITGGNIKGLVDPTGYAMAVWAKDAGTNVIIEDGNFTNQPDPNDPDHVDLIYASGGANIVITGGTFKCEAPKWTLNCSDNSGSTITVTGGKFYRFNPAIANYDPSYGDPETDTGVAPKDGKQEIFVPDTHKVIQNGDWYEVVEKSAIEAGKYYTNNVNAELNEDVRHSYSAVRVEGGTLTINGGNIHGICSTNGGYAMAVWANGEGSTIVIKDGYFTNDPDPKYPKQSDMIEATGGGHIVIEGGTFECATPGWTLNCGDNSGSTITVLGGKFYKFNPAIANYDPSHGYPDSNTGVAPKDGKQEIFVPDTHKVIQNGEWYEVVCAHKNPTKTDAVAPTYTAEGNIEYYTCNTCKKLFKDAACTEKTNAIEVIIPSLINVGESGDAKVDEVVIDEAIKESGNSPVVELPLIENATSVTVPVESVKAVDDANKGLTVETKDTTVTLDAKAVEEVAKQAGTATNITIEVTKTEEKTLNKEQKEAIKDKEVAIVLSAKILADGNEISNFNGGKVKVEIPFTPAEGTKGSDYKVYYVADDGKVEAIPTRYVKEKLVVELEHFSEYVVVKEVATAAPAPSAPAANPNEKDNTPKTGAISVIGLVVAMSVIGLAVLRKRD